jgi:hypothetical protein
VECLTFFPVDAMTNLERVVAYLERLQKKHIDKRRAAQQDDQLAGHLRAFAERMGADPAAVARLLREMRAVKETMYSRFEIIPWFWIISDIVKSVEKHLSETNTPAPKIVFGTLATGDINGQIIDHGNQEYLLVTLDDGTIAFANLLTKAVAENLPLKPGGSGLDVERDPELIEQWINRGFDSHQRFCELFLHYAVNGNPHAAPAYDPLPEYIRLSTAWRRAMEFFIVSHEFGHACLGHLGMQERARIGHLDYSEIAFDWDKEFQADHFGLKTTLSILKQDNIDPGTIYAGIEMFFYGQEFLHRTRARFLGAEFADRGTNSHPPIELRLAHLRSVLKEYLNPAELAAALELCDRVRAMFDTLWPELERQIDLLRSGGTVVHKKWQPRRGFRHRVMECLGIKGGKKANGGVSAAALR